MRARYACTHEHSMCMYLPVYTPALTHTHKPAHARTHARCDERGRQGKQGQGQLSDTSGRRCVPATASPEPGTGRPNPALGQAAEGQQREDQLGFGSNQLGSRANLPLEPRCNADRDALKQL